MPIIEPLQQLIQSAQTDPIALFFLTIIGSLLALGMILSFSSRQIAQRLSAIMPNTLTTMGVLGTFFGIAIGLLDFDVTNIDDSVPELLAGLKLAFVTSIGGISGSIVLKIFQSVFRAGSQKTSVGPEDIYGVIKDLSDHSQRQARELQENLGEIRKVIAADGDTSLLTQLQKFRTEARDGQNDLVSEFKDFAKHMVENNQKAIIEALQEVIRDFNTNLTEQFGENFKQLNEAVEKLVIWQESYKGYIDRVEQQISIALESIDESRLSLEAIKEHSSAIPEALKPLPKVMASLNAQVTLLEKHLEALSDLREKAIEAFPVVENNLELITTKLGQHVELAVRKSSETLDRHTENYKTLESGLEGLQRQASNAQQVFHAEFSKALDSVNAQMTETVRKHGELIDGNARAAQETIKEAWTKTDEEIEKQMKAFDDQMGQELERAIEQLGSRLAALSEKFVSDYEPLTRELRNVVDIARRVPV